MNGFVLYFLLQEKKAVMKNMTATPFVHIIIITNIRESGRTVQNAGKNLKQKCTSGTGRMNIT